MNWFLMTLNLLLCSTGFGFAIYLIKKPKTSIRKLIIVLYSVTIVLSAWLGYWVASVILTFALGMSLFLLFYYEEKMKLPGKSLFLLAAVFIVLILPSSTVLHQVKTEVGIIKNLEKDGWYWTQVQLPADGELLVKASLEEYLYWRDLHLSRVEILGWNSFFGRFCCGETIPNKYVFLPLEDPQASQLIFFLDGGKAVWEIEIPEELQTPSQGEIITQATIYYH